jgi:DNA-binding beta-propeller fold protein YncE
VLAPFVIFRSSNVGRLDLVCALQVYSRPVKERSDVLTPATPPQPVPIFSGFDYVTVDAQRRRVYAAHGGGKALLIVDADSGKVLGQVKVGRMAGDAVDPATGRVFSGDGSDDSVSEVDPVTMTVLRSVDTPGHVDAIAYDPANAHLYADEDDGTRLFVIDARTMTLIKTIALPGHKPEFLAVDPETHDVYQNISDLSEIAVIDPVRLTVQKTISTPEIKGNHPLQYDSAFHTIVIGGNNGVMSSYTRDGERLATIAVPRFDQCNLDPGMHVLACAGSGGITRVGLHPNGALSIIDTTPVNAGVHTTAIDPVTHAVFTVWSNADGSGDFVQKFIPEP